MITLARRATNALQQTHRRRAAHNALTAALYGDYKPARRLVERTTRRHGALELAAIANVWADAHNDAALWQHEPVTPLDTWVADLLTARADAQHLRVAALIAAVDDALIWHHLGAVLAAAAAARLEHDSFAEGWPA